MRWRVMRNGNISRQAGSTLRAEEKAGFDLFAARLALSEQRSVGMHEVQLSEALRDDSTGLVSMKEILSAPCGILACITGSEAKTYYFFATLSWNFFATFFGRPLVRKWLLFWSCCQSASSLKLSILVFD